MSIGTTPTYDELLAEAPPSETLARWMAAYRGTVRLDARLSIEEMLRLGTDLPTDELDDAEAEALFEWFDDLRRRALAEWIASLGDAGPALVRAAVEWMLTRWPAEVVAGNAHDLGRLAWIVDHAGTPEALAAYEALPSKGPPPPYVGHLYGAVGALLGGLTAEVPRRWRAPLFELAEALTFCSVTPAGGDLPALAEFLSSKFTARR